MFLVPVLHHPIEARRMVEGEAIHPVAAMALHPVVVMLQEEDHVDHHLQGGTAMGGICVLDLDLDLVGQVQCLEDLLRLDIPTTTMGRTSQCVVSLPHMGENLLH